jgi:hypothetical protein
VSRRVAALIGAGALLFPLAHVSGVPAASSAVTIIFMAAFWMLAPRMAGRTVPNPKSQPQIPKHRALNALPLVSTTSSTTTRRACAVPQGSHRPAKAAVARGDLVLGGAFATRWTGPCSCSKVTRRGRGSFVQRRYRYVINGPRHQMARPRVDHRRRKDADGSRFLRFMSD